jgi:hypothetical protein
MNAYRTVPSIASRVISPSSHAASRPPRPPSAPRKNPDRADDDDDANDDHPTRAAFATSATPTDPDQPPPPLLLASSAALAACPATTDAPAVAHSPHATPRIGVAHDTPVAYAARRAAFAVSTNAAADVAAAATPGADVARSSSTPTALGKRREEGGREGTGRRLARRGGEASREPSCVRSVVSARRAMGCVGEGDARRDDARAHLIASATLEAGYSSRSRPNPMTREPWTPCGGRGAARETNEHVPLCLTTFVWSVYKSPVGRFFGAVLART